MSMTTSAADVQASAARPVGAWRDRLFLLCLCQLGGIYVVLILAMLVADACRRPLGRR